jgi:uncharacterized protein YjbI with pentapeptide repeats
MELTREEREMSDDQMQRPTGEDRDAWKAYWTSQRMPWRTEPEIDEQRQQYLADRRMVKPGIEKGIYPFKDIKLTRADIEWLLATHESGNMIGPVDWSDVKQRQRGGLDLRAAVIEGANLSYLPLARLQGGLTGDEFRAATLSQLQQAGGHFEKANFRHAHLEGSALSFAHINGVGLESARLEEADLYNAHLEASEPANLQRASFDSRTALNRVVIANDAHVGPFLGDVRWNGAILTGIDWGSLHMLGEEYLARQDVSKVSWRGTRSRMPRAVRANRQLATELRTQGLTEDADRFAYRAQLCQRVVLRLQHRYLRYLGSLFLWLIAGYGYKPLRSLFTYLIVVLGFAAAYYVLTPFTGVHFEPLGAVVFSITSFHGRGFSPGESVALTNLVTVLAAGEAIIGLLIEITFIATFTQRFFAR